MIGAKIVIKGSDRELGWWQFMNLPRVGEIIVVTLDEVPLSVLVSGVMHVPIIKEELGTGKPPVPYTVLVVDEPEAVKTSK